MAGYLIKFYNIFNLVLLYYISLCTIFRYRSGSRRQEGGVGVTSEINDIEEEGSCIYQYPHPIQSGKILFQFLHPQWKVIEITIISLCPTGI